MAGASDHRTEAFSLASREIESLHADPYALVGFYGDQAARAWKGSTTVILGPCSTTCSTPFAPLILPAGTDLVAGVTYTIARYVDWADTQGVSASTSTTFSQAYKATTVTVAWSDQAGQHSVEQDSALYPGGLGVYTGPGASASTTTTTTPVQPPDPPSLAISATQPASPQSEQEIDLTITPSASGCPAGGSCVQVQWSTDAAFLNPPPSQSVLLPSSTTFYGAQGLVANAVYYFRAFAQNNAGTSGYSATASGATAAVPAATTTTTTMPPTTAPGATTTTVLTTTTTTLACNLGAFSVTTATTGKTYLTNKGAMSENVVLNLAVNGSCLSAAVVTSVLHGTSTLDPGAPYVLLGLSSGGQWSTTVAVSGQTSWTVGLHDMTVVLGGVTTSQTQGLLICAWKAPGQRSSLPTTC